MKLRFGLFFLFFGSLFFCAQPSKNPTNDPYSLETLSFLEEVLLDVWESTESRETALSRLRYVCRTRDTDDGFICYTWGLIEFNRENYSESYTAFQKALQKNPNDSLYKNMLRLSAERSNNLPDLKKSSKEGEVMATFSIVMDACRKKEPLELSSLILLADVGLLTKDHWKKGVLSSCLSTLTADERSVLEPKILSPIVYKDRLLKDQMRADPFSKIWDTSYFHKREFGKEREPTKSSITEAWQKVKIAAETGNESLGREGLLSFSREIALAKKKGKADASLAIALEISAKLLLEQDPGYSRLRNLAKEL